MLCIALTLVFVGASTATIMNRMQHSSEATTPHEHMLLSDVSYLADHDDQLHGADHHGKTSDQRVAQSDIHALMGGDESPVNGHSGHHHHHQGEVGGNMVVLGTDAYSPSDWQSPQQGLAHQLPPHSAWRALPERPPRTLENRA